jgi:hypothetical protein
MSSATLRESKNEKQAKFRAWRAPRDRWRSTRLARLALKVHASRMCRDGGDRRARAIV